MKHWTLPASLLIFPVVIQRKCRFKAGNLNNPLTWEWALHRPQAEPVLTSHTHTRTHTHAQLTVLPQVRPLKPRMCPLSLTMAEPPTHSAVLSWRIELHPKVPVTATPDPSVSTQTNPRSSSCSNYYITSCLPAWLHSTSLPLKVPSKQTSSERRSFSELKHSHHHVFLKELH